MAKKEEKDTKESKKEPETKEPDETTEATTEPTPEDVSTLIEKTLAEEEKKRQTRSKIQITLIAAGLSLLSVVCLYLIAYNNVITGFSDIAGVILGSIISGILGGMIGVMIFNAGAIGGIFSGGVIGGVIGGTFGGIYGAIAGFIIGGIFSFIIDCIIWNTTHDIKKEIHPALIALLSIVFLLPFVTILIPLSKHHNQNLIRKDTIISEAHLQIKALEDGIEILLPSEHASDNSYLEKVFSVCWEGKKLKSWKNIAIPCREGGKYWYKVKLPLPYWYKSKLLGEPIWMIAEEEKKKYESNTDNIVLFFKHPWENYRTTEEILFPDPTDPNSL